MYDSHGGYVGGEVFGYNIGVEFGMHSKENFNKDLDQFIVELSEDIAAKI